MSTVLPCDRAVVRATPGILGPVPVEGWDTSSSSVSGYGEKYLAVGLNDTTRVKEGKAHVPSLYLPVPKMHRFKVPLSGNLFVCLKVNLLFC